MIADEAGARQWVRSLSEASPEAIARLECLIDLLVTESARQNLVSAASLKEVWRRHIADSVQLLLHVPRETSPWLDLGAGAGFPGLVIAALRPDIDMILVESRKRRIEWLERAATELSLPRVRVLGQRLEHVESFPAGCISARAFAPLAKLLDLAARFSTNQTLWVLPKGRSAPQELAELRGWNHQFHVKQSLTDPGAGVIVGGLAGRKGKSA